MAKKLAEECGKALKALLFRIETAEKFVVDQAPDICKEILTEKTLNSTISLIGSILVFGTLSSVLFMCVSKINGYDDHQDHVAVHLLAFVCGIAIIPFMCQVYCDVVSLLTVKRCPKLVVLRELRKMIGN